MAKCVFCAHEYTTGMPVILGKCPKCHHDPNERSYKCDGGCGLYLAWRFTATRFDHAQGATPFSLDQVWGALRLVVSNGGYVSPLAISKPAVQCLCEACYLKKAGAWDANPNVYRESVAKTADDGVFFNANRPDYYLPNGSPNVDKIRSTMVHELIHWSSINTKGFQRIGRVKNVDWDECMTDALARETYRRLGYGAYLTGYGRMSEFIDLALEKLKGLKGYGLTQMKSKPETMPAPMRGAFQQLSGRSDSECLNESARVLKGALFNWFATWYFQGTHARIVDVNADFQQFINEQFDKLFPAARNTLQYGANTYR